MKLEAIFCLVFCAGKHIKSSDITFTGSEDYILSNESFTLTCSSSAVPRGETASFFLDNIILINVRYVTSVSSCYGIPQDSRPAFICDTKCSCSSDIKQFKWTYSGLITKKSVIFKCEMDFGTSVANRSFAELLVDKAYGPSSVSVDPNLVTTTVREGDQLGPLSCTANCVPACTYIWSGPGVTNVSSVLEIANIQRNRTGIFRCRASNTYGNVSVELALFVQFGPHAINVSPYEESYIVEETSSVGPITCSSSCYPVCTHVWTGPGISAMVNELHLTKIKRQNAGQFTCTASNVISSLQKYITITVEYGPSFAFLNPNLTTITVNESDQTEPFQCLADCVPTCSIIWSGPGITDDISILNIKNIQRSNRGSYFCTARNMYGSKTVDIFINVQFGPDTININPPAKSYYVEETRSVGPITCTSSCYPLCKHEWSGPGVHSASSQLYLTNIKRDRSGRFTCTSSNVVSSIQDHITIFVEYGPSQMSLIPVLSTINVRVSENIGPIRCTADCVPACAYIWSGPYITTHISVLIIMNIQRKHNGTYMCTATNTYGNRTVGLDIGVQFKPYLDPSKSNSPSHIGAVQHEQLMLIAFINAYPAPLVHWTFRAEGKTIYNTSLINSNTTTTGFHTLSSILIDYVQSSNFGEYTVTAGNSIGELVHRFIVKQQGKPMPPVYVYAVCKSTTAVLIWKPGFNGGLSQDFYIYYAETGQNMTSQKVLKNETSQAVVYTVTGLNQDSSYIFSIHAVNSLGEAYSQTVDCSTDDSCSVLNEKKYMFPVGISTLFIGLIILVVTLACKVRKGVKNRAISSQKSDEYANMQRSNPVFSDPYTSLQCNMELKTSHGQSINTYEECGTAYDVPVNENMDTNIDGPKFTGKK